MPRFGEHLAHDGAHPREQCGAAVPERVVVGLRQQGALGRNRRDSADQPLGRPQHGHDFGRGQSFGNRDAAHHGAARHQQLHDRARADGRGERILSGPEVAAAAGDADADPEQDRPLDHPGRVQPPGDLVDADSRRQHQRRLRAQRAGRGEAVDAPARRRSRRDDEKDDQEKAGADDARSHGRRQDR